MNKKKCEQKHASRRFLERSQITFSRHLNDLFVSQVRNNKAKLVYRTSIRASVWDIPYNEKIYRCVYDRQRKQIVTLLFSKDAPITKNQEIIESPPIQVNAPQKQNISVPTSPTSNPVEKYGFLWKSAKKLENYEKHLNKRYEKDYEKWIKEKEKQSRLESYELMVKESKQLTEEGDFI